MRRTFLLPLLMLPLPLAAQIAPATPHVDFTHHDWTIACDNTRTCRAAGYQDDASSDRPVSVLLTRRAGPDAPVKAQMMLGSYEETTLPATLHLRIDGADQGALDYNAEDGTLALRAPQTAALLASLRGRSEIVLSSNDDRTWTLSGNGASAVLLKMDEFQGRLGTPGALVRTGKRAEASVLPALPVPQLTLAPVPPTRPADSTLAGSPALRAALAATTSAEDCAPLAPDGALMEGDAPEPLHVTRLSADKLLVSVACWRGAYNEGSGYWVINDRAPYAPILVTLFGNEAEGNWISGSHKGRGLGDCWSFNSWGWTGTAFVATGVSTTGLCRLVAAGGAWTLPTYVTDERP